MVLDEITNEQATVVTNTALLPRLALMPLENDYSANSGWQRDEREGLPSSLLPVLFFGDEDGEEEGDMDEDESFDDMEEDFEDDFDDDEDDFEDEDEDYEDEDEDYDYEEDVDYDDFDE